MDLSTATSVLDETEFGLQRLALQKDSEVFLYYHCAK